MSEEQETNRNNNFDQNSNNNFLFEKDEKGKFVFTFVRSIDSSLCDTLMDLTNNENFINKDVNMHEDELFPLYEQMKLKVEAGNFELLQLVLFLNDCFAVQNEQYNKMTELGKITFDHLSKIFHIGSKFVAFTDEGEMVGSVVNDAKMQQTEFSMIFKVSGIFTFSNGRSFYQETRNFVIPYFSGMTLESNLNVRPMTKDDEKILTERGKIFSKYALNPNYVTYTGTMFINTMYGPMHFDSTGRIMIDHVGSRKNLPKNNYYNDKPVLFETIPDDLLYLTWPFFDAFSFKAKKWGKAYVKNVSEVEYNDSAFNSLVLHENKKKLIKALVMHSEKGFTDIISDKSGGCIFLLHGPPGNGKTLTAEVTAELLHKPLYSLSVGELGTTADNLEKKLSVILEMTESWNSVLLIDECDIFLEARRDGDIEKSAMVGIFLRLLERHKGVMFLTTNRINSIDSAFESRISIVIQYEPFSESERLQVWKNLLTAANITSLSDDDLITLSKEKINGRQIKNSIRMSQALACDLNQPVNVDHFNIVINNIGFNKKNDIC